MAQVGWLKAEDRQNQSIYGYQGVTHNPFARAVFAGMMEYAHLRVPPRFMDPGKSEYIERRYAKRFTSKVITSYLVFD